MTKNNKKKEQKGIGRRGVNKKCTNEEDKHEKKINRNWKTEQKKIMKKENE